MKQRNTIRIGKILRIKEHLNKTYRDTIIRLVTKGSSPNFARHIKRIYAN